MTEYKLDIQTIFTKRTDFRADRVLLLALVKEKKEKADPSVFSKFLLANSPNGTFGITLTHKAKPSQNQKSRIFLHKHLKKHLFCNLYSNN
jgi:F0F1-type ATP synthase delta subunit